MHVKGRRRQGPRAVVAAVILALSPVPALGDWRDEIGTFRIGLVGEPGAGNSVAGLADLTDAYSRALGMKVEFFVAPDYAALIDAQAASQIEYAVLSATAFATAFERCRCVEPLVAPVAEDGAVGFRSVLIARTGTLASVDDMDRYRIAVLPADSVAGRQLPVATLSRRSGPLSGAEPFLVEADSATAAEAMFVEGKVDALFGWLPARRAGEPDTGGTLARLQAAGLAGSDLLVLWRSEVFRFGPHTVRASLDPEPKRRLSAFLTALIGNDPVLYGMLEQDRLGGFELVTAADYGPALAIVRSLAGRPAAE